MSLRIGFIGSGFAAKHIEALKEIPEAHVVAISSRNESKARELIQDQAITYYSFDNYKAMLKKERLDAVYICLPPHLHGELELVCSEHVKGLLIEKPIALNLDLAHQLNEQFKKANNIVSVGYMNRYRKNILQAKEYFSKNPAILIRGGWCDLLPPPYWWRQRNMSGGQLTEQCTHILDSIRFIAGEFEEVQAYSTKGFIDDTEDFNVDDAMIMNFKLKNGTIGSIQTSCFSRDHGGGSMGIYMDFSSREKTYRFSEHQMNLNIQHSFENIEKLNSEENALLLENQAFLNALKNGHETGILSTYSDSIKSLKIGLAADLSIKESKSIKPNSL